MRGFCYRVLETKCQSSSAYFFFLLYSFKDFSLFDFRKQILAKLSSKCPKKRRKKERHYKKPGELLLNTA